jgi:PEP-CTERM motif
MPTAACISVRGVALFFFLFLAAPRSEADVIFDFSGVCLSGDCDPGSEVMGELHFTDQANLSHRTRSVTAADFVSLALGYATVERAQATAEWHPGEGGLLQPIDVGIDAAGDLKGIFLHDDLENAFQLDENQPSRPWRYREYQITPEGQVAIDVTFGGNEGVFVRRGAAVPEPTTLALLGLGLGAAFVRRR